MKRIIYIIVVVVLLALVVYCAWNLISLKLEYSEGSSTYESLRHYVHYDDPDTPTASEDPQEEPTEPTVSFPTVDFPGLWEVNKDTCAWIYGLDGKIDYPVAQGPDNYYYLRRLIDGTYNRSGCLFLDYNSSRDFSDANTIIYGHNMQDNSMFALLEEYKEPNYWKQHPTMLLMTPKKNFVVRIFAGYVATVNDPAWQQEFETRSDWQSWMDHILESSGFNTGIRPRYENQILTLSTCSYDYGNARYVLFGILEPHELP